MEKLLRAAARFRTEVFEKNARYSELKNGQSPEVAFIACSDSRVIPNSLTGTAPGELFVLRNAGNLVASRYFTPNGEAASLEYAVEVLKVKHVVVCGHTKCGAVQYLLDKKPGDEGFFWVSSWLTHAEALRTKLSGHTDLPKEQILRLAVENNVSLQLEHLMTYPFISEGVKRGTLQLHGWLYEIETGNVCVKHGSEFRPLT